MLRIIKLLFRLIITRGGICAWVQTRRKNNHRAVSTQLLLYHNKTLLVFRRRYIIKLLKYYVFSV